LPAASGYWLFFAGSLDGVELEELELDGLDGLDGLDDAPAPALDGLDELELEFDGLDGLDGVDGLVAAPELEEPEPDIEPGDDGDLDGEVAEPLELPVPDVVRSAPRSHAAIRLAPSASETATAMDESFMLPP